MRFESVGAGLYYSLGSAYYLFHWFLIFGGAGLVSSLLIYPSRPVLAAVVSVLSLAVIAGGFAAWMARTKKRLDCQNPDLIVTKLVSTYDLSQKGGCTAAKEMTVLARHSGVDSYRMKFKWTGDGDARIRVTPAEDFTIQREEKNGDTFEGLRVFFRKPLSHGERCEFTITLQMEGDPRGALPFLQLFIDDYYPNGLTMRVVLPETPRLVRREVFRGARSVLCLASSEERPASQEKVLSWSLRRPLIGRRYKMSWLAEAG